MKRKLALLLIVSILLTSVSITYAAGPLDILVDGINKIINITADTLQKLIENVVKRFKDISIKDWFISTVAKLVELGGIDGYDDGTFRPKNTITKAEYTKIVVGSLGFRMEEPKDKHWATNYMNKAEELGLIDKGEMPLKDYNVPITRNEAVKIAVRACEYLGEKTPSNYQEYKDYIRDYNSIPTKYKEYVLKGTAIGLIDGYDDSTFRGNNNLTRAEGATIIVRIFDKSERVDIREKGKVTDGDFIEPQLVVELTTEWPHFFNYFEIIVDNYMDYLDKNYTFKTECISHPELNKRLVKDIFDGGYFEVDHVRKYTIESSKLSIQFPKGKIYELYCFKGHLNPKTKKPYSYKDGEKMTFKVTVSNGKTTKTYEVEAVFKNKRFLDD